MMEFTMSRAVMGFCGLLVLSAVIGPFSSLMDSRYDAAGTDAVDAMASMFESWAANGVGASYTLEMRELLPSSEWHLILEGQEIRLSCADKEFTSYCSFKLCDERMVLSHDDRLAARIPSEGEFHLEKVSQTTWSASMSLLMSSASL